MKITNFTNYGNLYSTYVNPNIEKLLVLGCGDLRHEMYLGAKHIFGVDWADEKLNIAKEFQNTTVIKFDINNICQILLDKSFDAVALFDIVEHLTKDDALKLLKDLEEKIKNQIIIFIPIEKTLNNFAERMKLQEERKSNNLPMGCHLSIWTPSELDDLGYVGEYSPKFHKEKKMGAVFCVKNLL